MNALKNPMLEGLNRQMNEEFFASFLYLSLAAYFEENHLDGFAGHFKARAEEERQHALKIYDHILRRHGKVVFEDMKPPKATWATPLEAVQEAFNQESSVTQAIHELFALSKQENDYGSEVFLQWFVNEQIQEETEMDSLVGRMKLTNGDATGTLLLDMKLKPAGAGKGEAQV